MTASVWDDPDLRVGGEFVTFDKVGDSVAGTINAIRPHRFNDGSVAPQILLTTDQGEERTVTCGAIRLKTEMATQRPEPGDHVSITLASEEPRGGGKTLRHWTVVVTRGGRPAAATTPPAAAPPAAAPAATPAAAPAAVDPAAAAAALANLTPEQKAALGL